ncbi:hypothetical protein G4B88_009846 [Cannabis sativa]|uniref:CCHC-type domain-containing protein n=1 Tax=Cannabis sativa TaxID=3483 RepID=A0A7J6HV15_CANSA|nr:hypothetical protein G4B88_009846 [Cannabis sativa]
MGGGSQPIHHDCQIQSSGEVVLESGSQQRILEEPAGANLEIEGIGMEHQDSREIHNRYVPYLFFQFRTNSIPNLSKNAVMGNSSDSWKNDLTVFPIWGRALGVPIDYLTEKNTTRLASMAGSVITIQNSDVSRMVADGFFRFQVWMSINKPVCPGFLLPCTGHKKWVAFKYDDLPFMCFRCGWIGHSQKDCSLEIKEIIGEDGRTAMVYGTWLKIDNGVRDGFQVVKGGIKETVIVHEQNIQGGSRQSLNISMGNSFEPLLSEEVGHDQRRCEVIEGKEPIQGSKELNKLQYTRDQYQQEENEGETNEMAQDGRGKRRLVEDREVVGAGKLQRTASKHMVMSESQNLVDVLIGFSMDIPGLKESLPFAFGSGNNLIPKEQRRKVAVKKDAKKRKSGKPATVEELKEFQRIVPHKITREINEYPLGGHASLAFTKDGNYIVKSGYRVAREINLTPTRSSNMDQTHAWWKMWWNLNLSPRMKLFGWKMCRNWLPAKSNLVHRGMRINPTCTNCGRFEESLSHALWTCENVKKVWKLMPSYKLIKDSRGHSMMDLLVEFRYKLAKEEFEDVVKVLWAIWENRNRQWTNQHYMHGARLLE